MQHTRTVLDHGFEYVGGNLGADFTNTRSGRYHEDDAHDHLGTYADVVEFVREAGELRPGEAKRLLDAARERPERATQVYRRAIALREATWRALSKIAAGREPAAQDVDAVGVEAAAAQAHRRLTRRDGSYVWAWPETDDPARPLWPIAVAAAHLLTDDAERGMVRECADETCAWIFVDRTKNHSRRWCDMASCGARNKMREYRERRRKSPTAAAR